MSGLSPLLTFASLFQMKEWRIDRLREHLRREGWFGQLISLPRLLAIAIGMALIPVRPVLRALILLAILVILAGMTLTQLFLRKQRMPDWTAKAKMIVALALLLTAGAAIFCAQQVSTESLLPAIVLLEPAFVLLSWLILLPVDRLLKRRIFDRAKTIRQQYPDLTVIGIAGSVGKTTTKELIRCVLQDTAPLTTPIHVNTEMGVAQWMTRELPKKERTVMIVEMGAYRTGEIALLSSVVQPTIGVVTAIGSDHLALFGSEKAIIQANAELPQSLPTDGHLIAYGDSDGARAAVKKARCTIELVGISKSNDLRAEGIEETDDGLGFTVEGTEFSLPLRGTHNVGNALLAIAVGRKLGITMSRMKKLLKEFDPLPGTFQLRVERGLQLLDDTYNVSPLSFHAALDWAAERTETPKILLTSGLLEVGTEEHRFLRELGEKAKGTFDRVVFTTDRGRTAFAEGFKKSVELLSNGSEKVPKASLLVCVGRMNTATIRRLLP